MSNKDQSLDFDIILEVLEYDFEVGEDDNLQGNALVVWKAISYCLENNISLPAWVKRYLQKSANEVLAIENPGKEAPNLIQEALSINGRDFKRLKNSERDKLIFYLVDEKRNRPKGKSLSRHEAFREVVEILEKEELKGEVDTVRKAYDRKNIADKQLQADYERIAEEERKDQ